MPRTTMILVTVLATALGGVLGGCDTGPATLGSPDLGGGFDKRPCPSIAVTYSDPGTIDDTWSGGIKDFSITRVGDVYHLIHITDPATSWTSRGGEQTFGHALSHDLVNWYTFVRIDLRTDGAGWSPSFTWAPHIIHNEADGLYYMFYTGVKWDHGTYISRAQQRVGLARSPDLFHWERYDDHGEDGLVLDGPDHETYPWSAFDTDGVDLPWEYDCRDPFVFDRGPEHGPLRYLMLNSIRLAPDADLMAIACAASGNLLDWQWLYYYPVTVGDKAESANLVEEDGNFYLFWSDRDEGSCVRVACSTTGIFGEYELINDGERLFGSGNETLLDGGRTRYLAFDDEFVLHVKRDLLLPEDPGPGERVRVVDFTGCDGEELDPGLAP